MSVSRAVKHSDIRDPPDNLVPKNKFSVKTASAQDAYDKIAEEMQLELEDTRAELQNELNARDDAIAARLHEERADTIDKISKLQRGYEDVRQKAEEANERLKEAMERLSLENSSLKSARANDEELFLKLTLPIRLMPYRTQLGLPDEQIETDLSAPQVSGTYSAIMPLDDHCFDLDTIISKLKKAVWSWPGTKVQLLEAQIWWLCTRAKNVFMSQPALLEVNAPINIVGDIRGQYHDLLKWFQDCGYPPKANYLFLGNYVDYGTQSLETICLCFALKIKYPDKFFMLRGSHERQTVNLIFGFYNECRNRYRSLLWSWFIQTMNCMPFAAIINGVNDKIFCVSGGLSPHLENMDQIRDIPRPAPVLEYSLAYDLLTSVPATGSGWDEVAERGAFGRDISWNFCEKHKFNRIVRASQYLRTGYVNARKARIVSLWSAPGFWAGKSLGAILIVNEKLELFSKLRSKDMCTKAVSALKEITRIALKIRNVDEDEDDLDYDE